MSQEIISRNFSIIVSEIETSDVPYDDYDRIFTDLWVGVVLTLMVLSCVGCLCSCFLYHKFQQWKCHVLESRGLGGDPERGGFDVESLPSYTLVTGLPTYEEALEQLRQVKKAMQADDTAKATSTMTAAAATATATTSDDAATTTTTVTSTPTQIDAQQPVTSLARLSVDELLQFYRADAKL